MKRFWTNEELEAVRGRYPNEPTAVLASSLGRTLSSVYQAALSLGLKKSTEYLASPAACRLRRGEKRGMSSRFPKGNVPFNKGLTGWTAGGRSAETQFKKGSLNGRAAEIVQPIGAERLSKDGYLQRKINNGPVTQARWKAIHAIVWEQHNGPILKGHIAVFKTADKTNFSIENIEVITRVENMRRNTYHRYPEEIARAIQLRGALNRQINKRMRASA